MGRDSNHPLVIAILCLFLAVLFLYLYNDNREAAPNAQLNKAFEGVVGWKRIGQTPLDLETIDALDLDDYLFSTYAKGTEHVNLYIGYYKTAKKVGAAHSPLVCFPGQGWEITPPKIEEIETSSGTINLASMVATKGMHKELLFFWYQANDKTSSGTFMQKVNLFLARINSGSEGNAFVRVSLPIYNGDHQMARFSAVEFIRDFYPNFLIFINS